MKQPRPIRLGYRLAIGLFLLALGFGSQQACLPGPTTLQIESVINCGTATEPVVQGTFDVGVIDTYYMKINLINMLVVTADPGLFRPESNFIDLKEAKVWFEYPSNFSRQALGAKLLKTKEDPLRIPIAHTLRPSLQGDFLGRLTAGTGGVSPTGQPVEFYLIPTELSRLWVDAVELNVKALVNQQSKRQTGASFQVIAHITISGMTRAGQVIATPEYRFPIRICKGCLDSSDPKKPKSLCGTAAAGATTGVDCRGQDRTCFTPQQSGNP